MTEQHHGPPKKDGGRAPSPTATNRSPKPTSIDPIHEQFDALAGNQRRRETALRKDGGENPDPATSGRQYHRPPTGFRAAGFRDGYAAALRYVLREFGSQLNDLARAKLTAVIERSSR